MTPSLVLLPPLERGRTSCIPQRCTFLRFRGSIRPGLLQTVPPTPHYPPPPASSVVCSPTPFRCLPICECSDSFSLGSFRRCYHPARVYGLRLYGMFNRCPNPVDNHFFPFGITYHPRSQVPKRNVWYHVWQRLYPFPHLMGEIEEDFSTPNVNLCGLIPLPRKIFPHSSKCARPPKKIYSGPPANRLFQIHPVRRSE